ncbi:MAG: hypothetical protein V4674_00635 [Patescibacteria group bacterium]
MNSRTIETFGWIGAMCILGAYALVSMGKIGSGSLSFQLLNFVGALGVTLVSWKKRAYQPAIPNLAWAFVALAALTRLVG